MPTRPDESPPRQQDRFPERGRRPRDEVSSFETDTLPDRRNDDGAVAPGDDPDINTHGSER
jgi:hypothetical protein